MPRTKQPDLAQVVDTLGDVKAQIDHLKTRERELRDVIEASGQDQIFGKRYKAVVSRFDKRKIDYAGLLAKLAPSTRLLNRFTTILRDQCRVTTRPLPRTD